MAFNVIHEGKQRAGFRPCRQVLLGRLTQGIQLRGLAADPTRIELSRGAVPACSLGYEDYRPEAVVPRSPWRSPSAAEYSLLTQDTSQQLRDCITIVRPPAAATEALAHAGNILGEQRVGELTDLLGLRTKHVTSAVGHLAALYSSRQFDVQPLGLVVMEPGMATTTRDSADNLRIGLHIDSWFRCPVDKRRNAPNRLCLNVGSEIRRLLFVNLPLSEIVALLSRIFGALVLASVNPTDLARIFLGRFSDYPIVSLKIEPGEAYIAPTENMVHDGSTLGMKAFDATYTLLGDFQVS